MPNNCKIYSLFLSIFFIALPYNILSTANNTVPHNNETEVKECCEQTKQDCTLRGLLSETAMIATIDWWGPNINRLFFNNKCFEPFNIHAISGAVFLGSIIACSIAAHLWYKNRNNEKLESAYKLQTAVCFLSGLYGLIQSYPHLFCKEHFLPKLKLNF